MVMYASSPITINQCSLGPAAPPSLLPASSTEGTPSSHECKWNDTPHGTLHTCKCFPTGMGKWLHCLYTAHSGTLGQNTLHNEKCDHDQRWQLVLLWEPTDHWPQVVDQKLNTDVHVHKDVLLAKPTCEVSAQHLNDRWISKPGHTTAESATSVILLGHQCGGRAQGSLFSG